MNSLNRLVYVWMATLCLLGMTTFPAYARQDGYDDLVTRTAALLKQNMQAEAQAAAQALIEKDAMRYEGHRFAGILSLNQSKYDAAESELNLALERAPKSGKGEVQRLLLRVRNTRTYVAALADAEAAITAGDKAKATLKYAEAAHALPVHTETALKAVQLLTEMQQYLDAAEAAAHARDAAATDAERKTAIQALKKLQPYYQKSADLQFVDALRQIKKGQAAAALPVLEKIARLTYEPGEGLLTLALVQFKMGAASAALEALSEWLRSGKRSLEEIANIRLATYYDLKMVQSVLAEESVRQMLIDAFGKQAVTNFNSLADESASAEEPMVKTINPKDSAIMILIPAGPFPMGERGNLNSPRRAIELNGYWIYEKLVTVAMYKSFCQATGRPMPAEPLYRQLHINTGWKKESHPMINVSWSDAVAYGKWAGVRLPTEAEWEKAARGTEGLRFPWGNRYDPRLLHHSESDGDADGTAPVGKFPDGASPYGALDMAGNVFQWCSDYYLADYWKYSPKKDPLGPQTGSERVVRGGSWFDDDDVDFFTSRRAKYLPDRGNIFVGFRCASKL